MAKIDLNKPINVEKESNVALVYAKSGGGKTVNSTLVKTGKRGKNLLLCSDNSYVVLRNFARPNLDIETIEHWMDETPTGKKQEHFNEQFEKAVASQKYDNIIVDNVSDLFDLAILEMDASGRWKDMRQAYQLVYQNLKRLARAAGNVDCGVIFTCWHETEEITLTTGQKAMRVKPKLPMKILDNFLGLCNIVAYINTAEKNGETRYYYHLVGSETMYAKDQLHNRKTCLPEDIFSGKETE
jgi:phage nucleotide-binding protein